MSSGPASLRFDAGWLFIIAGLMICAAGVILPAQRDLAKINHQLATLKRQEFMTNDRLAAHERFLADLEASDPALLRRLAASQLNLMREGEKPFLLSSTAHAPITQWIDSTVRIPPEPVQRPVRSALATLSSGAHRLWFLAGGVLCVFIGLLLDASWSTAKPQPLDHGASTLVELKDEPAEAGVTPMNRMIQAPASAEPIVDEPGSIPDDPEQFDQLDAAIELDEAASPNPQPHLNPTLDSETASEAPLEGAAAQPIIEGKAPPMTEVVVVSEPADQLIAAENSQSAAAFDVEETAEPSAAQQQDSDLSTNQPR